MRLVRWLFRALRRRAERPEPGFAARLDPLLVSDSPIQIRAQAFEQSLLARDSEPARARHDRGSRDIRR